MIKLLGKVRINAVSLEHISSKISPTGKLDSAPKDFAVYVSITVFELSTVCPVLVKIALFLSKALFKIEKKSILLILYLLFIFT